MELALKLGTVNSSESVPQNLLREGKPETPLLFSQVKANFGPCRAIMRTALDAVPFPAPGAEGTATGAQVTATVEQAHLQLDRTPTSVDQYGEHAEAILILYVTICRSVNHEPDLAVIKVLTRFMILTGKVLLRVLALEGWLVKKLSLIHI